VGAKVALQGNVDPNVLFAGPEVVAREARKVLESYGNQRTTSSTSATASRSSRRPSR
jgi:uroporphyrinogen-III decarboxylase